MADTDLDFNRLIPEQESVIEEIVRQAEERLKMQVQMALAADLRAGLVASLQSGGAIALVVAASEKMAGAARAASLAAAVPLAAGAVCAVVAAMPIAFGMIGTAPSDWLGSIATKEDLKTGRAGYAVWLDKYLKANDRLMLANNNWFRVSLVALVLSPIFAGIAALLSR